MATERLGGRSSRIWTRVNPVDQKWKLPHRIPVDLVIKTSDWARVQQISYGLGINVDDFYAIMANYFYFHPQYDKDMQTKVYNEFNWKIQDDTLNEPGKWRVRSVDLVFPDVTVA